MGYTEPVEVSFKIVITISTFAFMIEKRQLSGAGYGTHITPLIAAVLETKGNVIEMGMGDYSTPLLHELIKYKRLQGS